MRHILKLGLTAFLLSGTALTAQEMTAEEVKRLALEAILENPQVIMEAVAILQERDEQAASQDAARVLSEQRVMLEQDPNAPVLGNPEGDVTVVEFFDYNCPYCKQVSPEVEALIAADSDVRVVFREWPILSDGSVFAARAALASREQDLYPEFHLEMMRMRGRAEEVSVMAAAEKIGLDLEQLRADMEAPEVTDHIEISMNLARLLGFNGTPSFVIGDSMVPGMVPLEELQRLVAEARGGQ
ncbi:DsbA family protein [Aliiroseovarius sp. F20344]|uniref:DsbA family protein n=1 Tax=Aliiroseovarius sp. F20344 TaxID=2926414 RepID=UPI001FF67E27|nr:DsbA family protein [Aliiroseovarius sp. F20344]MCK0141963.1 DsbA family protein [Aliiroseovarius sp. F20344]